MTKNKAEQIEAAIIGLGNVGYKFSLLKNSFFTTHWEAYLNNPKIKLVAVADTLPSPELLKEAKARGIRVYRRYQDLLKNEHPKLVSIATPDQTHFEILKATANHPSVKAIWCEKPLAIPLNDAKKMVTLCKAKRIALCVNFVRRYDPLYHYLKNNLATLIGKPQALTFYYTGGVVTTGSHLLDLLVYLFGNATSVSAVAGPNGIIGTVRFGSFTASLVPLSSENYSSFEFNLFGSSGRLDIINKFFGDYEYRLVVPETNRALNARLLGKRELAPLTTKFPRNFFAAALENVIDSITTRKTPVSSGESALASLELIHALVYSSEHGGVEVKLPFKHQVKKLPVSDGNFKK